MSHTVPFCSRLCCPRCPVAVHLKCAGMTSEKQFQSCTQHKCIKCNKSNTTAGGWLFRCNCCPAAYCEDHVPKGARFLERCERMEELGYFIKHGVSILLLGFVASFLFFMCSLQSCILIPIDIYPLLACLRECSHKGLWLGTTREARERSMPSPIGLDVLFRRRD